MESSYAKQQIKIGSRDKQNRCPTCCVVAPDPFHSKSRIFILLSIILIFLLLEFDRNTIEEYRL